MAKQRKHIRRSKKGRPFIAGRGKARRKKKVAIPPAWKNVKFWNNREYIATGIDEKGRLQYIYPRSFVNRQQLRKHRRVDRLDSLLSPIIEKIIKDADKGNQEAQAVYTLFKTGFRPGTDKDTLADKKAYGVTTLRKRHVKLKNGKVNFKFTSKKGVKVDKDFKDKRLNKYVKERLKSTELFDTDINKTRAYFKKKTRGRFQLKDLRTLRAHKITDKLLKKKKSATRKEVGEKVSEELGNTPAIALKSYVDPRKV